MNTRYVCHYNSPFQPAATAVSTEGIAAFKDGFWINSACELTKGSDAWAWIPPSAIVWIEKEQL